MTKVIEKYYCDRCGKETDKCYHSELKLSLRKCKHFITIWRNDHNYGRYETSDLCEACAKSFDEWWKGGR